MAIQLEGKVAIITGASSGIGAATALAMAKAGIDVVLVARRRARLEEVAKSVRHLGRSAHVIVGDVSDMRHVTAVLDEAEHHFGRFDIVFANAGYGMERPVHLMEDTELRAMFEVNFFSSVALLRESAKRLCAAKRPGHLLMCSSCLSKFSMPNLGAYAASKAAQESICRAMRFELAADHIEVASVHPITTTTEFFSESSLRSGTQEQAFQSMLPSGSFRAQIEWQMQSLHAYADQDRKSGQVASFDFPARSLQHFLGCSIRSFDVKPRGGVTDERTIESQPLKCFKSTILSGSTFDLTFDSHFIGAPWQFESQ